MMGMKGPGGCRGQKECDSFCSQPEHGEECFNFAKRKRFNAAGGNSKNGTRKEIINKLEKRGGGPGFDCRVVKNVTDIVLMLLILMNARLSR